MAIGMTIGLQSSNNDLKLTLSKNFISINKGESTTITIDTPSDGKIYAISSNPNIVTASVSNNIITINAIKYGSVIITIGQDTGTGIYTNITPEILQLFVLIPLVVESTLNNNDWEIISQVSQEGTGNQYWSIGDMKSITLNGIIGAKLTLSNFETNVFILHFNHPMNGVVAENNIIWGGFKDNNGKDIALADSNYKTRSADGTICFNINHWGNNNYGGWKGCDFRYDILGATSTPPSDYGTIHTTACIGYDATSATLINPKANTLLAALPSDFRNSLRLWSRWIDAVGNSSNIEENIKETVDAITLLTEIETTTYNGYNTWANKYEIAHQAPMEYYVQGNSRIKYTHNDFSSSTPWWLASPYYNANHLFCDIAGNYLSNNDVYVAWAVAPAFKT